MEPRATSRELLILETLRDAAEPLGAWNLVALLEQKGVRVGASTAGRLLNRLEKRGWLAKSDVNQGRTLTDEGRVHLRRVEQERHLRPLNEQLSEVINSKVLENDLMVLEARRAIERATVRLAAARIREEELQELERLVRAREEGYRKGETIAPLDVAFHTAIARASGNEVLRLLYETITSFGQQSRRFESIRRKVDAPYQESHRQILEALRAHDPDRAERHLIRHIDGLIRDVKRYWDEFLE